MDFYRRYLMWKSSIRHDEGVVIQQQREGTMWASAETRIPRWLKDPQHNAIPEPIAKALCREIRTLRYKHPFSREALGCWWCMQRTQNLVPVRITAVAGNRGCENVAATYDHLIELYK